MPNGWAQFDDPAEAKGFALIQNAVMRDPSLSMQAKYLYGLLKSYAWQDPSTYPGVNTLCAAAGVSKDTLGKYLKELIEASLIEVKRRGQNKTNLYVFKKLGDRHHPDGDTGSRPDGDTGSDPDGDTGSDNEDSVNEDSVTSRKGADALPDPLKNPMGYFSSLAAVMHLYVDDDRPKHLPENLVTFVRTEKPTKSHMIQVITHILSEKQKGFDVSPQQAWLYLTRPRKGGHLKAVDDNTPQKIYKELN